MKTKEILTTLASIASIITVCIAIIALVPAFGAWLFPKSGAASEKQIVFLLPDCGYTYTVNSGSQIDFHYGSWAAKTDNILDSNLSHITVLFVIDGKQIDGLLSQQKLPVSDLPCRKDLTEGYWTYFSVTTSPLSQGNHLVDVTYNFDTNISDGYDLNHDGMPDIYDSPIYRTYTIISK